MRKIEVDHYRFFGNYSIKLKSFRDYRFRYLYCWRKVNSKSKISLFYKFILKSLRKHYHIEIPYTVSLGAGFSMDHAFNITINSKAILGGNVTMYKGSTIGSTSKGVPVIGNQVYIGLNSTIVGNCTIGNDVLIAPNSYVNFDVPDHSIVIGNPGKIIYKDNITKDCLLNISRCLDEK